MVRQMSLFSKKLPYKYIIDSSSIFSQKDNEPHRRTVYRGLWKRIEQLIQKKEIVTSSEIADEIKDKDLETWLRNQQCVILPIDESIQQNVTRVVSNNPKLVDFKQVKSSGDAFLIATAMEYHLTIITEENQDSPYKIPKVAENMGVKAIDINELCQIEDWQF